MQHMLMLIEPRCIMRLTPVAVGVVFAFVFYFRDVKYLLLSVLTSAATVITIGLGNAYDRVFQPEVKAQQNLDYSLPAEDIVNHIPEDVRDEILIYGIDSRWHCWTNTFPCMKYCDWQEHYIELSDYVREDMTRIFETEPPKWLVIENADKTYSELFTNIKDTKYKTFYENEAYILLTLK